MAPITLTTDLIDVPVCVTMVMMNTGFEEVPHTADIAVRVWGCGLDELFVSAAVGMAHLLAEVTDGGPSIEQSIEVAGDDAETLLVAFLGELLYLQERDGTVFHAFEIRELSATHLLASAFGHIAKEYRHHIKAVTFSDLEITQNAQGYEATVVFDV